MMMADDLTLDTFRKYDGLRNNISIGTIYAVVPHHIAK
jgi:hypothetical protein